MSELESRLTYQERAVDELSRGLYDMQSRLERVEQACRELGEQVKVVTERLPDDLPADEKPPHY